MLRIRHNFLFITFLLGIQLTIAQLDGTIPPANIAVGNQFYCPGDKIPVVTDFDIQIADEDLKAYIHSIGKVLQPTIHNKIGQRPADDIGDEHPFCEFSYQEHGHIRSRCPQDLPDADLLGPLFSAVST